MESKTNQLEGKTDGASHDSFIEQASEMFGNFFKTVKEEIKNENKEFNVALIKFIKRFESFSQNQKVSAFRSFGTTFSVENVRRSKYNLPWFQEENLKSVVDKGRIMWEPKVYLIVQSA